MNSKKGKCQFPPGGWNNPIHQCRPGTDWLENSFAQKVWGVLVNKKLNVNQQYVLVAKRNNHVLGCIRKRVASKLMEVTTLCLALSRLHVKCCVEFQILQYKRHWHPGNTHKFTGQGPEQPFPIVSAWWGGWTRWPPNVPSSLDSSLFLSLELHKTLISKAWRNFI